MTDPDALRRLADVVDALQETPIDVDRAQLRDSSDGEIAADLSVTIPTEAALESIGAPEAPSDQDGAVESASDVDERADQGDQEKSATDGQQADADDPEDDSGLELPILDHTSTADLQRAYDEADGNISKAAERFEVKYNTVYQRMRDHGIHRPDGDDESEPSTEDDTDIDTSETEARDVDLEEAYADDSPAGTGEDVTDEDSAEIVAEDVTVDAIDEDDEDEDDPDSTEFRCEGCGETFESENALRGHGATDCSEEPTVELPDGVSIADVEAAVDEHEALGDVAAELGVTRGRARTITVALGLYGDVKDLPRGGS